MHSDPAWDEYMSTGIDPTGGDLGADFNPENKIRRVHKANTLKQNKNYLGCGVIFILIACVAFISYKVISNSDKQTKTSEEYELEITLERIQRAIEQMESEPRHEPFVITETESAHIVTTSPIDVEVTVVRNTPKQQKREYTPYQRGYWDGYDEGYDDRIQRMGYGYKYDCDEESYDYQQGYANGYKDGFSEGWEEYDAFGDDEY